MTEPAPPRGPAVYFDGTSSARNAVTIEAGAAGLRIFAANRHVLSVKRSSSASPATGSAKAHEMEQKTLITLALTNDHILSYEK